MNEFDMCQLNIMIKKILGFKSGKFPLGDLIYDLEALLNTMEDNDDIWKKKFRSYWADLEIIYALALEKDNLNFCAKDQKNITDAIENLTKLIEFKLH